MIQKGTKLKSRTTGAEVTVIAADFDMWGMTYSIEVGGLKKHYTYDTLVKEYEIIVESLPYTKEEDKVCKCGGEKTYNSKEKIYHSRWCWYGK